MEQLPGNSNRSRGPVDEPISHEKIKPITSARTASRKRGLGRKFKHVFFAGDAKSAAIHVVEDILIPEAQELFLDMVNSTMERIVKGEDRRSRRKRTVSSYEDVGRVNYQSYSGSVRHPAMSKSRDGQRSVSRRSRARTDFDDIILQSRRDVEEVMERMFDILSQYESVSVAHLYALTDIESSHTDMKWGWTDLRGWRAKPLRDGTYLLDLPEPEPLG